MTKLATVLLSLALTLPALQVSGADDPARLLPAPSCGAGWALEGKAAVFDRETLSDRINGEAEIFFPYGFQSLAFGRYATGNKAFDLDIYRMGSGLDAFGMFGNYRPDGADPLGVGTEGVVTATQLFFYQGNYFIRLQSTGEGDAGKAALASCAEAVSGRLPKGGGAPREAQMLAIPEVEQATVRYCATSLLGYDFLPRGLTADAAVAGEPARVFVVLAASPSDAAASFERYRGYLQQSGRDLESNGATAMTAVDPLYGNTVVERSGRYVFGMVRVKETAAALPVMEKLRSRLGRYQ
jgi:hypothetical protein